MRISESVEVEHLRTRLMNLVAHKKLILTDENIKDKKLLSVFFTFIEFYTIDLGLNFGSSFPRTLNAKLNRTRLCIHVEKNKFNCEYLHFRSAPLNFAAISSGP